ncbi:MAG: hypothetical protein ACPGNT_02650 [Rhodospirillales bacterium]
MLRLFFKKTSQQAIEYGPFVVQSKAKYHAGKKRTPQNNYEFEQIKDQALKELVNSTWRKSNIHKPIVMLDGSSFALAIAEIFFGKSFIFKKNGKGFDHITKLEYQRLAFDKVNTRLMSPTDRMVYIRFSQYFNATWLFCAVYRKNKSFVTAKYFGSTMFHSHPYAESDRQAFETICDKIKDGDFTL